MPTDQTSAELDQSAAAERGPVWRVWLLVGIFAFLLVQGAVDGISRSADYNIYPTVAMPGFSAKNVGSDGFARITKQRVQLIGVDQSLTEVGADQLLAPLNSASAVATLDRIFAPKATKAPSLSTEAVQWLRTQSEKTNESLNPIGVRVEWQPMLLNIKTANTTPAGPAIVREVRW